MPNGKKRLFICTNIFNYDMVYYSKFCYSLLGGQDQDVFSHYLKKYSIISLEVISPDAREVLGECTREKAQNETDQIRSTLD